VLPGTGEGKKETAETAMYAKYCFHRAATRNTRAAGRNGARRVEGWEEEHGIGGENFRRGIHKSEMKELPY